MDRDYSFLDSLDRGMYFDKKEYDGAPLLVCDSGFIYQRTPSDRGQRVCEQFRGRRV